MGCVVLVLLFYLDADSARLAGPERCGVATGADDSRTVWVANMQAAGTRAAMVAAGRSGLRSALTCNSGQTLFAGLRFCGIEIRKGNEAQSRLHDAERPAAKNC